MSYSLDSVEKILKGDIRTAAHLMRDIDDGIPGVREILKKLYPYTGNAFIIGITGFPGSGKSTLIDKMVQIFRGEGKSIGIVAVDPSSPFTGGALLGDRIRMNRHATDPEVFIKSLATRGHVGGLSRSTKDIIKVMEAMGKDIIIVETVGVGQDEVEIVKTVHTSVVTLVPGLGDEIQTIKAGILEIADIFVVNKADRDGADRTVREIEAMLELDSSKSRGWSPLVLKTEALNNKGIKELVENIYRHKEYLQKTGKNEKLLKDKISQDFLDILKEVLMEETLTWLQQKGKLKQIINALAEKKGDPYTITEEVVKEVINPLSQEKKSNEN